MADKNTIKNWFRTGLRPTQAQFWATWDSFRHKDEKIPITAIDDIENILAEKADAEVLTHHLTNETAHTDLFLAKEDKSKRGAPLGYAPLNEVAKLAVDYLNIVNDLVTGGEASLLTAEQGKVLKTQIDGINTLLTSNDVNLDTVQELVNAIKTVQTSLSTILVNDLSTGGTTKALTAEMGKTLKGLIDGLTTALGNKVDKVAGERLINAGEITKLAGLGSITTTVKPILSTALGTQNVAGFVTYINALNPVLVVGANEIVKYNLTDTGRVFELNLRGRSFGVGQPAIVAADILEVTDFLNKDIRLSNYPSTRNDGQLPTNKVLSTDANGNLKMYTIATAPAPYLEVLVPDSTLPSTTTNFILKGAFFTPTMTVAIAGQTINYITFVSDNLVKVNVTTGATEGSYAVTLNNGIQAVFPNALLIVLGTVYSPLALDFTSVVNMKPIDGGLNILAFNSLGSAKWNKTFNSSINWEFRFQTGISPLATQGINYGFETRHVLFKRVSDNVNICNFTSRYYAPDNAGLTYFTPTNGFAGDLIIANTKPLYEADVIRLKHVASTHTVYVYVNNTLKFTYLNLINENMYVEVSSPYFNIFNIKYIELAS
jgi:hypothetical protein